MRLSGLIEGLCGRLRAAWYGCVRRTVCRRRGHAWGNATSWLRQSGGRPTRMVTADSCGRCLKVRHTYESADGVCRRLAS